MTKLFYFCALTLLSLASNGASAQVFGPEQQIGLENLSRRVIAVDLNNDGFKDVVTSPANHLNWYKNMGQGDFGPPQAFGENLVQMFGIDYGDLDGDGDADILASLFDLDQLVWFENMDGLGTFSAKKIIGEGFNQPDAINVVDLDGDNDLDVVLNANEPILVWFENNGNGTFQPQHIISQTEVNGRSCFSGDMDGDGDIDVVSSATPGGIIVSWFENLDGQGTFGPPRVVSDEGLPVQKLTAADLDGDGDLDVITTQTAEDMLSWNENLGGGTFGPRQVIFNESITFNSVFAVDVDNDGDIDILSGSAAHDVLNLFINTDGMGTFGPRIILNDQAINLRGVFAADLDNDGDQDALSCSIGRNGIDDYVSWYENQTILGVTGFFVNGLTIFPNPSGDILNINGIEDFTTLKIYDASGKLLIEEGFTKTLDISSLQSGVYFIELRKASSVQTGRFIKE